MSPCISARAQTNDAKPATPQDQKETVNGLGGVFFKAHDPQKLAAWYREHLGIQSKGGYADFVWRDKENPDQLGRTVWALFPTNTSYFGSSSAPLMINYRVAHLDRLLTQLRGDGVAVDKVVQYDYGRFAWITDPEGNRIELWEPKALSASSEEEQIRRRLQEILAAAQNKDFAPLDSYHLYGPKFSKFTGSSPDRLDADAARKGEHEGLGAAQHLNMRADALKIDLFGNVAVATFILDYSFEAGGQTVHRQDRSTLLFVKDEGQWKITHEHLSPINR
jgi:ketosteroid isomerase-like protein/catechol 2,3-dioxygenase-like lactoylglutathione lyase family enzyme